MSDIEGGMRTRIAEFLPCALGEALASYQVFLEREHTEIPKDFKAYHDACKAAISHVELLLKLADKINMLGEDGEENNEDLVNMIENAKAVVGQYKAGERGTNE